MKKTFYFCLAVLICTASQTKAQTTPMPDGEGSVLERNIAFDQWLQDPANQQTKGWKYKRRHLWNQQFQTDANGNIQGPRERAAVYMEVQEKRNSNNLRGDGWQPAGPAVLPNLHDETLQVGLGRLNCIAFHPTDNNTYYVGAASGGIWKTTNDGADWTPLGDDLASMSISDILIDHQNPDNLYVCTGDYEYATDVLPQIGGSGGVVAGAGLYRSTDAGETWQPTAINFDFNQNPSTLLRRTLMDFDDSNLLLVGGFQGVFLSEDGGVTFTEDPSLEGLVMDIEQCPFDAQIVYASVVDLNVFECSIHKSEDFGTTWTELNIDLPDLSSRVELAVSEEDCDLVYGISVNGENQGLNGFHKTTDGGETWTMPYSIEDGNLLGWELGNDEGGQGLYDLSISIDPEDSDHVVVGGVNIWSTTDGGDSFKLLTMWFDAIGESVHADQHQSHFHPNTGDYFIANDGGLFRTSELIQADMDVLQNCFEDECDYELPTQWQDLSAGIVVLEIYKMDVSENSDPDIILGTQDNSTYIKKGGQWWNINGGDGGESGIGETNGDLIFCANPNGAIHISLDKGESIIEGVTQELLDNGQEAVWVAPAEFVGENDDLYIGLKDLFKFDSEEGESENLSNFMTETSPIETFYVNPGNTDEIFIAHQPQPDLNTVVQFSNDGGESWAEFTDNLPEGEVHITSFDYDADDEVYFLTCGNTIAGAKVYKTNDAGEAWENISKDLPNFSTFSIKHHTNSVNNTLYLATDQGVFHTNDDMDTWEVVCPNLPNVRVKELRIHAADEQLYAATYGRGVWQTDLLDVELNEIFAVGETSSALDFTVFPNPSEGKISIDFGDDFAHVEALQIKNALGQVVYAQDKKQLQDKIITRDLVLPAGAYYINVKAGKKNTVKKIIVK